MIKQVHMLAETCLYALTLLGGYLSDISHWAGHYFENYMSLVVALVLTFSYGAFWHMRAPYSPPNQERAMTLPSLVPNKHRGRCWSVAEKRRP
ncbi:unnamed protein product [Rhizoctonia solani]|uniref:Uncharacterized protein n=1 Tax=Rhizoctonia solani TaxID=456999 RepID=A0A8H2XT97_9AGAM|nr:unnamed protein product [Rhizoctonia solani]